MGFWWFQGGSRLVPDRLLVVPRFMNHPGTTQKPSKASPGTTLEPSGNKRHALGEPGLCWGFAALHTLVDSLVSSYGMCRHMSFVLPCHVCLADLYGEFQSTHLSLSTEHIQTPSHVCLADMYGEFQSTHFHPSIYISTAGARPRLKQDGRPPRAAHVSAGLRLVVDGSAASTAATTHWARGAN